MTFAFPLLLTRPAIWECFGIAAEPNAIGDTIGGITAPVVNLVGALLVFYSFKEQSKANMFLQADVERNKAIREYDEIADLIKQVESGFKNLKYDGHEGLLAMPNSNFDTKWSSDKEHLKKYISDLIYFLETTDYTSKRILNYETSDYSSKRYREFSRTRYLLLYRTLIEDGILHLSTNISEVQKLYDLGETGIENKVSSEPDFFRKEPNNLYLIISRKILNIRDTIDELKKN